MSKLLDFFLPAYVAEQRNKPKKVVVQTSQEIFEREIYVAVTIGTTIIIMLILVGIPLVLTLNI